MRRGIITATAILLFALPSCQSGKEASKPPVRLGPEVKRLTGEILAPMEGSVTLQIVRGSDSDSMGEEAQALVDFIAETSQKVSVNRVDIATHPDAIGLGVPHGPVIEMKGKVPGTLRYYGFPERKEIRPFLEGVLSASGHPADLTSEVRSFISGLGEEVWIRIFTTPD